MATFFCSRSVSSEGTMRTKPVLRNRLGAPVISVQLRKISRLFTASCTSGGKL